MNLIEGLTNFNLTKQEATLYVLLLKSGQMTGYEAAKQTGISRSNTYTALAGLVDKGAAYVHEQVADPPFLAGIIDLFRENHCLTIEDIAEFFEKFSRNYVCEKMDPGSDFDMSCIFWMKSRTHGIIV